MKTAILVCAALLTFSASAYGMCKAGWFSAKAKSETPQVQCTDPMQSEAAMRYRTCQQTNWRLVMTVR